MGRVFAIPALAAVLLFVSGAVAQSTRQSPTTSPPATPDASPLAGPAVEPEAWDDETPGLRARPRQTNPRRFFDTIRKLELTPPQRRAVAAVMRDWQEARRVFRRGPGGEMDRIRRAVRAHTEAGEPVPIELQAAATALGAAAPKPAAFQRRIWDILDEAQRATVKNALRAPSGDASPKAADRTVDADRAARRFRELFRRRAAGDAAGPASVPGRD